MSNGRSQRRGDQVKSRRRDEKRSRAENTVSPGDAAVDQSGVASDVAASPPRSARSTSPTSGDRGNRVAGSVGSRPDGRARRQQRQQLVRFGTLALTVIGLAALIYVLWTSVGPGNSRPESFGTGMSAAQQLANQGQDHITVGQSHPPYNSSPATSGWHYGDPQPWGVFNAPVLDERQVHNLEHGGIMLQYNCPNGCPDVVEKLTALQKRYPNKSIVAPYPGMDARIALTAWRWIDKFNEYDERRVIDFIEQHKNQAPERFPD